MTDFVLDGVAAAEWARGGSEFLAGDQNADGLYLTPVDGSGVPSADPTDRIPFSWDADVTEADGAVNPRTKRTIVVYTANPLPLRTSYAWAGYDWRVVGVEVDRGGTTVATWPCRITLVRHAV